MDQNRPDNSSQQQNVHLHMHQVVCGCHGNIYPTPAYYQPVSFRTPPPPMVAYNAQQLARPYLQHYQYTQFNQYSLPVPQVAGGTAATVYSANNQTDILFGSSGRDRRERLEVQEEVLEAEKPSESSGFDYGHVSPPPNKDLLMGNVDDNMSDNFVKFLERSCITAEQIAHRNRNRPCFRNIQNLCVRTRSEILKPCTTVSNIHSQGIPWATKDFIYAFVRLTNCWHILRGYWENRDGPAIGKITRELTPEFRECYVRWEKETMELAAQLTKVFYNLDTNINSPLHTGSIHSANNLVPPQINLMKNAEFTKTTCVETMTSTAAPAQTPIMSSKSTRGVLHLPSPTETVDQGNQTCSGDFFSKSPENTECLVMDNEEEEDMSKVYMKPGSYSVPKRTVANNTETTLMNGSPRTIEFLETAQNVNKVMEAATDRYWSTNHNKKVIAKPVKEDVRVEPHQFNVQKWIISSRFSDYDNASTGSSSPPNIGAYYIDTPPITYGDVNHQQEADLPSQKAGTYTLLQREKTSLLSTPKSCLNGRSDFGVAYRKKNDLKKSLKSTYEDKLGGLTEIAVDVLEKIVAELKTTEFADYISQVKTEDHLPASNLDWILNKLKTNQYKFVNEVVRDLYYVVNFTSIYYGNFLDLDSKIDAFVQRIQTMLETRFNHFDFSTINGLKDELVGPLKLKMTKLDGDGDRMS
ncbi:uncharacterized protein LOC123317889 isoform X2 [Coccinella septempunctata]|uniref:uncharacterized protein LOC123317889 isoform X2 n=1 Tax=Coccinella septempunctata TaxID=41139 RepID=UPI001D08082D|nr:uncharacterized protein LOC123317889 isoform X2 [Coccinella septempunctata]